MIVLAAWNQDRRKFLASALAAPLFVPRSAWGANDRLAYGLIGAGGRGRYLNQNFQKLGAECVAVAEVYEPNTEQALKDSPNAKTYVDYHELLAQPGVDAVVIATPDHQHCPMLLAALDAKKDVYLEKPMSHSLEESQQMIAAVRKSVADRADRDAAPQRAFGHQGEGNRRQRHSRQDHAGQADVELERLEAAQQLAAARQTRLEALPRLGARIATWSRCASAPGATSGITPAAT